VNARNMYRREINKYIKQSCAPSWTYLRDYTGMQGQKNIKTVFFILRWHICTAPVSSSNSRWTGHTPQQLHPLSSVFSLQVCVLRA